MIWGGVSNSTNFGEDPLQSTAGDGPFPDENMFSPTGPGSSYARSDVLLDSNDALTGASFISIAELSTPPTGFAQAWANAAYTLTFDTVADGAITLSFSNSVSVVSTDALVRLQTEIVIRDLVNGDQVNWQPDGEPGNFSFSNPSGKGIQNSGLVVSDSDPFDSYVIGGNGVYRPSAATFGLTISGTNGNPIEVFVLANNNVLPCSSSPGECVVFPVSVPLPLPGLLLGSALGLLCVSPHSIRLRQLRNLRSE